MSSKLSTMTFRIFDKLHIFSLLYWLVIHNAPVPVNCQRTLPLPKPLLLNITSPQISSSTRLNTYKQTLDPETGLSLAWTVNRNDRTITFTIESSRSGFVALALTKRGILAGSDVIVFGTGGPDGSPYVLDMYGVDMETIAQDQTQDWRLLQNDPNTSSGSGPGLRVTTQRSLDTCDDQDMPIEEEQITVLWAHGTDANIASPAFQFQPEGEQKIYFFDPFILPESSTVNPAGFQTWRLARRFEMPPRPTSYWCSIHKMRPSLPGRHHIAGFNVYFANELAKRHVHHQILYRCAPPPGIEAEKIFEPFLDYPGEECYVNVAPILPSAYCREMVHIFAIGGEPSLFPETVGINIGGVANEYFMFEAHYNNLNRTAGVVIENGVDMYYTPELRRDDGSLIFVGHGALGTFVVPPRTSNFNMAGHCSKECSLQMVPFGGMDIIAVSLHAHTSTRRMRFKHFRDGNELPWIINDDEYDFQYQQIRLLESPRRVLPGDQLTVECGFDTHWKDGEAVASGFSTRDEMCMAFLLVNKALPALFCTSEYNTDRTMERFGIRNMTWDLDIHERRVNDAVDPGIVGLTLSQVVEGKNWTPQRTRQLEREQMYGNHVANCIHTRVLGGLNFYGTGFRNLTGGIIPIPLLDQGVPTVNAIRTPFPKIFPVSYPPNGRIYTPPRRPCSLQSRSDGDVNALGLQSPGTATTKKLGLGGSKVWSRFLVTV